MGNELVECDMVKKMKLAYGDPEAVAVEGKVLEEAAKSRGAAVQGRNRFGVRVERKRQR